MEGSDHGLNPDRSALSYFEAGRYQEVAPVFLGLVLEYFPTLGEEAADYVLYERTPYPMASINEVRKVLHHHWTRQQDLTVLLAAAEQRFPGTDPGRLKQALTTAMEPRRTAGEVLSVMADKLDDHR